MTALLNGNPVPYCHCMHPRRDERTQTVAVATEYRAQTALRVAHHSNFALTIDFAENRCNQVYLILAHVKCKNPVIPRFFGLLVKLYSNFFTPRIINLGGFVLTLNLTNSLDSDPS